MYDVIIIGAGAAGLHCAQFCGQQGKKVLLLEKANKVGKKILMSGGGRCNFTNLDIGFDNYLSHNPHFFKSALSSYTQWDFIKLVEDFQIEYYEKTLGQLFCRGKSKQIVDMLLALCDRGKVDIVLNQDISQVVTKGEHYQVNLQNGQHYLSKHCVIASGGLSIPTLGGSPLGYQIAEQFDMPVYPLRAGLVPLTLHTQDKERFAPLSGVSIPCQVTSGKQTFEEDCLFTHRGLSGPAILQISSFWQPGQEIILNLQPQIDLYQELLQAKQQYPNKLVNTLLASWYPKSLISVLVDEANGEKKIATVDNMLLKNIALCFQALRLKPNGTEGYRTAEVTLGGVDTNHLSSKTMMALHHPNLYFIGEVVDVSGWLGGYNFQWAWSSAIACGKAICDIK
jgi:predicted Rossmann fold flavoprotein